MDRLVTSAQTVADSGVFTSHTPCCRQFISVFTVLLIELTWRVSGTGASTKPWPLSGIPGQMGKLDRLTASPDLCAQIAASLLAPVAPYLGPRALFTHAPSLGLHLQTVAELTADDDGRKKRLNKTAGAKQ